MLRSSRRAASSSVTNGASRRACCARTQPGRSATATCVPPWTRWWPPRARVSGSPRRGESPQFTTRTAGSERSRFGDDLLRIGYLKGFMDGTLGSATARLLDGSGVEITSREQLEEVVLRGAEAHFPVAVHAIGDAANRAALDAFAATRDAWQPAGLRPRIEHAQLLAGEDVARFADIGVAASVQFSHAPSDRDLADRLWEGRDGAYAYRSLLDAGALLANGSDAPVEELDPLAGIVAGVHRTRDER